MRDLRPSAEDAEPSRMKFYVVSPHCTPDDASALANLYAQRVRLERTHTVLDAIQVPLILGGFVIFLVVLLMNASPLWYLVILGAYLIAQYMRYDAEAEVRKPLRLEVLERRSAERIFHRISGGDYRQANAFAQKYPERASEAHELLWRVCDLREILRSSRAELTALGHNETLSAGEIEALHKKLLALDALIKDAETSLKQLLNPQYRTPPLARDRLLELFNRVDDALSRGMEQLAPRIAQEQERVRQYQQELDDIAQQARTIDETTVDSNTLALGKAPADGENSTGMNDAGGEESSPTLLLPRLEK
ncbi:hypothetical protein [Timonella sp. A28]|uniref:hypothetical protein n=1 Tax=Timonella sp. A28 TaxID=3442640 RepID=UPI003EB7B9FB